MNRKETIVVTLCVLAAISTAGAQAPTPSAQAPAPGASAPPAPAAAPPRLDMKPPVRASREAPVAADARGCLEFPSNQEIIKCAEKYLHKRTG